MQMILWAILTSSFSILNLVMRLMHMCARFADSITRCWFDNVHFASKYFIGTGISRVYPSVYVWRRCLISFVMNSSGHHMCQFRFALLLVALLFRMLLLFIFYSFSASPITFPFHVSTCVWRQCGRRLVKVSLLVARGIHTQISLFQ